MAATATPHQERYLWFAAQIKQQPITLRVAVNPAYTKQIYR